MRKTFLRTHDELMKLNFDCHLSGSTACSMLFDSKKLFCANVGDSRAVLYSLVKKTNFKITPLSEDHKPGLPNEKKRIEGVGGRVEPILGPQGQWLGPDRVWMKNEDTPGLAMSRSLGDGLAHSLGVSAEPGKFLNC
jgi:serine/threonine protein phosphatase PrpC